MRKLILAALLFCAPAAAQSPLALTGAGGPVSCSQGEAYVVAAAAVDATFVGSLYELPIRQLICSIQTTPEDSTSNLFNLLDGFYILDNNSVAAAAINAVNPGTYNLTQYGSPTCRAGGCSGTDAATTTDYFDTGITIPSTNYQATVTDGSGSIFIWSNTNVLPANGGVSLGTANGTGCTQGSWLNPRDPSGNQTVAGVSTSQNAGANSNSVGFFDTGALNFGASTVEVTWYISGARYNSMPLTTSGTPSASFTILGCHNGSTVYNGDPRQIAVVGIGAFGAESILCHAINVYETQVSSAAAVC